MLWLSVFIINANLAVYPTIPLPFLKNDNVHKDIQRPEPKAL